MANHDLTCSSAATISSPDKAARQILGESPYQPIRLLRCSFDNGVLTIVGRVPTFYQKQLALFAVQQVSGVEVVKDLIQVSK